jgi:hypothetical protein
MNELKKGNVIGGVLGAPFELAGAALETALVPAGGPKPTWVRDAEIAAMREDKPRITDPAWRNKFSVKLNSGDIYLATFPDNLEAYKQTKNERYLSRAEQLAQSKSELSELELEVLRTLGTKAFNTQLSINGHSTTAKLSEDQASVLFISSTIKGSVLNPKGHVSVRLKDDLPFTIKDSYRVTMVFKFTIPRTSTASIMGFSSTTDRDAVRTVTKDFTFGPSDRQASANLDFGSVRGSSTGEALGGTVVVKVTGNPSTSFTISAINKL